MSVTRVEYQKEKEIQFKVLFAPVTFGETFRESSRKKINIKNFMRELPTTFILSV